MNRDIISDILYIQKNIDNYNTNIIPSKPCIINTLSYKFRWIHQINKDKRYICIASRCTLKHKSRLIYDQTGRLAQALPRYINNKTPKNITNVISLSNNNTLFIYKFLR